MWSDLLKPWQVCLELAWDAYCDDCIPIGAVVTDADGNVLTRGRNRIYEKNTLHVQQTEKEIAHAEVEALQALDYAVVDQNTCILYTTTEPCQMCMGMLYMSGLRTLHYAARDPWAGSVNKLGTTWYLSRKPIKVFGPLDPQVETILVALFVEQDCGYHDGRLPEVRSTSALPKSSHRGSSSASFCGSPANCVRCAGWESLLMKCSTGSYF